MCLEGVEQTPVVTNLPGITILCDITKGKDTSIFFRPKTGKSGYLEGHEGPTSTGTLVLIVTFVVTVMW